MTAARRRPPPERARPRLQLPVESARRIMTHHDKSGSRRQAATPREPRDGLYQRRRRNCADGTRRERAQPAMQYKAMGESRRRGAAVAERHAAVSAAARQRRREDRERGAAGSGAVKAARWQLPPEMTRPRWQLRVESGSCRLRHTAPRARAATAEQRRPSATLPRRRERGGTSTPARGARARRHRQAAFSARAARRRPPPERTRPRRQLRTESARCRLL